MCSVLKLCNKINLQEYRNWKVEIETFVGKKKHLKKEKRKEKINTSIFYKCC